MYQMHTLFNISLLNWKMITFCDTEWGNLRFEVIIYFVIQNGET
jgi:hypothetical protein